MCLMLGLAACSSTPHASTSQGIDVIDTALSNGAPGMALSVAQMELAKHPGDVQFLLREAEAYTALHQTEEAQQDYEAVLVQDPGSRPALMGLGRLILFSSPGGARALFKRVLDQDQQDAAAWNDSGIAFDLMQQHDTAQAAYRRAIAVDPTMVSPQVNLALSLAMSGNNSEAIRSLEPIAQGPASTPRIREDLALVLARAGDDDQATQILRTDLSAATAAETVTRFHDLGSPAPSAEAEATQ
jgi:Flp pilus assembly protein TadD